MAIGSEVVEEREEVVGVRVLLVGLEVGALLVLRFISHDDSVDEVVVLQVAHEQRGQHPPHRDLCQILLAPLHRGRACATLLARLFPRARQPRFEVAVRLDLRLQILYQLFDLTRQLAHFYHRRSSLPVCRFFGAHWFSTPRSVRHA